MIPVGQRLADARKAKAARGGYAHGQPPFGWKAEGGALVRNEAEQATIEEMLGIFEDFQKRTEGTDDEPEQYHPGNSIRQIADELNAMNDGRDDLLYRQAPAGPPRYPTRTGKPWCASSVYRILKREGADVTDQYRRRRWERIDAKLIAAKQASEHIRGQIKTRSQILPADDEPDIQEQDEERSQILDRWRADLRARGLSEDAIAHRLPQR